MLSGVNKKVFDKKKLFFFLTVTNKGEVSQQVWTFPSRNNSLYLGM